MSAGEASGDRYVRTFFSSSCHSIAIVKAGDVQNCVVMM